MYAKLEKRAYESLKRNTTQRFRLRAYDATAALDAWGNWSREIRDAL